MWPEVGGRQEALYEITAAGLLRLDYCMKPLLLACATWSALD